MPKNAHQNLCKEQTRPMQRLKKLAQGSAKSHGRKNTPKAAACRLTSGYQAFANRYYSPGNFNFKSYRSLIYLFYGYPF